MDAGNYCDKVDLKFFDINPAIQILTLILQFGLLLLSPTFQVMSI